MTTRVSPRTGKLRKRSTRPRMSLTDRIANLYLLLQSNSFRRWPLKLTFFAEDVFRVWRRWSEQHPSELQISATLDGASSITAVSNVNASAGDVQPARGIHAVDVSYADSKSLIEKSLKAFSIDSVITCSICNDPVPHDGAGTLLCHHQDCSAIMHMKCLSSTFLNDESSSDALIPVQGSCPECQSELRWVDLVKDLSLRMRGEKEIQALLKRKRGKNHDVTAAAGQGSRDLSAGDDDDDGGDLPDLEDEHEWHQLSDSSQDAPVKSDADMKRSPSRSSAVFKRPSALSHYLERVIDDSDWDEAEIIT